MTKVRQAGIGDLDALVPLFDAYRQFYKRDTDPPAAREFLFQRFQHQQSVIFIAHDDEGAAIGFTQLYPLFSSLTLARTFVLYDLFVAPSARRTRAPRGSCSGRPRTTVGRSARARWSCPPRRTTWPRNASTSPRAGCATPPFTSTGSGSSRTSLDPTSGRLREPTGQGRVDSECRPNDYGASTTLSRLARGLRPNRSSP